MDKIILQRNMLATGHYFREKGQRAEAIIHDLATQTFLTDWCYPNPKKSDGKELCDLLVVFVTLRSFGKSKT